MTAEQPPKILNDFEKAMKELLGDHSEDLELLKDIPTLQHALVQHEVRRLDKKLGKDHKRVRNLRSNLEHNAGVLRSFSPDVEKPEAEEEEISQDAVIMGRLVDEKNIAMAGMTVDVEDEGGRKIPYLGGVKTDSKGNFILRIDPESVEKVKGGVGGTGYLTVRDHKGKVVHQDAAPLRPDKGGQMSMNVAVSTEKFSGKERVLKPRGAIKRPPMDTRAGKGSPGMDRYDGKGDDGLTPAMGEHAGKPAEFKPAEFKDIQVTDDSRIGVSKAADLIGDAMAPKRGDEPKEMGKGMETAKGAIGLGGDRMEDDEGEEEVQSRGMAGKGGRLMYDESEEGDTPEPIIMKGGKGDDSAMGMAPTDVPPGPMPDEVDKKTEKKGFFRKGKGNVETTAGPDDMEAGAGKKMGRKERRGKGK